MTSVQMENGCELPKKKKKKKEEEKKERKKEEIHQRVSFVGSLGRKEKAP